MADHEDEAFYILEGQFEFWFDNRTFEAGPGAYVYLPKGRLHMHKAAGGRSARALVMHTPAGLERFIAEAGKPVTDRKARPPIPELPELQKAVEIAKKYNIEVPPPPA